MSTTSTEQLIRGTIKRINADRGFGFINRHDVDHDVFFHCSDCLTQFDLLTENEIVTFEVTTDARSGRTKAVGVCRVAS